MQKIIALLTAVPLVLVLNPVLAEEPVRQPLPAYLIADSGNIIPAIEAAAQKGDTNAQMFLGILYFKGGDYSFPKDPETGKAWFLKAIDSGDVCAMGMLGYLYSEGEIVTLDYDEAAHWLKLASDKGGQEAQWELLKMYNEGKLKPHDDDEVRRLIIQTAENGFMDSRAKAAEIYLGGHGIPQDLVQAYKWISLAVLSARDDNELSKKQDEIAALLMEQQLETAKNKVRLWKSNHYSECEASAKQFI